MQLAKFVKNNHSSLQCFHLVVDVCNLKWILYTMDEERTCLPASQHLKRKFVVQTGLSVNSQILPDTHISLCSSKCTHLVLNLEDFLLNMLSGLQHYVHIKSAKIVVLKFMQHYREQTVTWTENIRARWQFWMNTVLMNFNCLQMFVVILSIFALCSLFVLLCFGRRKWIFVPTCSSFAFAPL